MPDPVAPQVITQISAAQQFVAEARRAGKTIGLVPTMGALHAGHLSLVEAARRECDVVVVTIFVNPTQFGPKEDFAKYPRDLDADLRLLAPLGVEAVFAPTTDEMYPQGYATFVEVAGVTEPLEGAIRPGHYRGVATVVLKLFNAVPADVAFFGQKDFQQALVIRRMTADLDLPIAIRVCPIVRESDGLAMSSRNAYLSAEERQQALVISRALGVASMLVAEGERAADVILTNMRNELATQPNVRPDYIVLADGETLAEVNEVRPGVVALIAARVGATRLIDNEVLLPRQPR